MAKLSAVEAARLRMAMVDEAKLLREGMMNPSGEIGAEYPRMLYRRTTEPEVVVVAEKHGRPAETSVTNAFHGLLCDTIVAETADDAERLLADGWDISPAAAHGVQSETAKAVTEKDQRIADLEAQIAAMQAGAEKRGPGRPRREETVLQSVEATSI